MILRAVLILCPLLLLGAAPAAPDKAQALAGLYGRTLGAAALCPAISPQRLDQAAVLASHHVTAIAGNPAAAAHAGDALAAGVGDGRREVADGLLTCAQAESDFANLEHELSR